jgi:hypothetical protein
MKKSLFKTPMLFAALVGTACSAWGAMETESINFTVDDSTTATGTFPLFDSSQGTLTSVAIDFSLTTTTEAIVYSLRGAGYGYNNVNVQSGTETIAAIINLANYPLINLANYSLPAISPNTGNYSGTTTGPMPPAGYVVGSVTGGNQTFDETVASVSSFIGTGSAAFTISALGNATATGTGPSSLLFGSNISSAGSFDVIYTYIAVPEASQFPLFTAAAAGLVGMGGLVRRIRRSRA